MRIVSSLLCIGFLTIPTVSPGEEMNQAGWAIPDLRGLVSYSIQVRKVNGMEKVVEKFLIPEGGHVSRISGNGKIFAYAVDSDGEAPIDYLLRDSDGSGRFTQDFGFDDSYNIPEWISC